MISILIPIYNYDIVDLALTLNKQCKEANVLYEILCFDDKSKDKIKIKNRSLDQEFGISYLELSENNGRAKIRNKLARQARYENLIFLDCDSKITNSRYIKNYLEEIENHPVIYGGRVYKKKPPRTERKLLHWTYGTQREALPLKKRVQIPYRSFQTNNFCIQRNIMLRFPFNETILNYGYEDLVFAEKLKNEGIPILHIENSLIHKGVEYNDHFLAKSKLAAENLAQLYHDEQLTDTRMIKFFHGLKKIGFNSFLHKFIQNRIDRITQKLIDGKASLLYFDFYRYYYFYSKLIDLKASSS